MKSKYAFKAVIFDLDGVITRTALTHSWAWKEMFDHYLRERERKYGEPFSAFTHAGDYLGQVDGKPRYEGVKSFLESRGIILPYGNASDDVSQETYCGIGNRKNIVFNEILERDGVEVYDSTVALMHRLKQEGIRIGVASSSKNCEMVLKAAGLLEMVETRIDGVVSAELGLKGKPEPDIFTMAADKLGAAYHETAIIEDAISGVQAGKNGKFGLVLGIARDGNTQELYVHGADIVVSDIEEIGFEGICRWFEKGLDEDSWSLHYYDYDPAKERSREALLSVGNGYFGTRGALEEMRITAVNYPGTYLAAGYNRLVSNVSGRNIENEDLVNVSNWLPMTFAIEEGAFMQGSEMRILSMHRVLHFKNGVLEKEMLAEDALGRRTLVRSRRFASMNMPHLAAISYTVIPINYSGTISIRSSLTADHINDGVKRYAALNQQHLEPVSEWAVDNCQQLKVRTSQSGQLITQTARLQTFRDGQPISPLFKDVCKPASSSLLCSVELDQGQELHTEKIVLIQASHWPDDGIVDPVEYLQSRGSLEELLAESALKWEEIWERIDIQVSGDRLIQKLLRLHLYHLMSTCSPHNANLDFSIPARGLSGEAYRGHIFWDEVYVFPLYIVHFPDIARAILMYRYRRLEEARAYALKSGYKGAMFPWQSGSTGREETQEYHYNPLSGKWDEDFSSLQRHVNLAIAYNVIQYHSVTADETFMLEYGAGMLIEMCRFWESMTTYDPHEQRYSVSRVMGPDEFHEHGPGSPAGGVKNNAYTNIMMAWLFRQCLNYLESLGKEEIRFLQSRTAYTQTETAHWKQISENLRLSIREDGILEQFDGYFDLQEIDWDEYGARYGQVYRMDRILKAEGKSPDAFKVAKQADTLMLFYLLPPGTVTALIQGLGYTVPLDYVHRNMDYYLPRTSHGSTLSRLVHARLAEELGRHTMAWTLFSEALRSDYDDLQGGTTAEGIHAGVMAGSVWMVLDAFGGVDVHDSVLSLRPRLPEHWPSLKFSISFRCVRFRISLSKDLIRIQPDQDAEVRIQGETRLLKAREEACFFLIC